MKRIFSLILFLLIFANGAIAAPVQFLGGETGTAADEVQTVSGFFVITTSNVKTGTYAYDIAPNVGGGGTLRIYCPNATGALAACSMANAYIKFDFDPIVLPNATQGSTEIAKFQNTGFALKATVRLNSAGKLVLLDSTGATIGTGTTTLVASTYYRIEIFLPTGTSATGTVKLDGNTEVTGTGNWTASGTGGDSELGISTATTNGLPRYVYDNIVFDDAAYPGAVFVHRVAPDGDGSTAQWTAGSAPSNYTTVDEVPMVNTDYEQCTTGANQVALVSLASSAASGISGTIAATKTWVSRMENTSVTSSNRIRTREGATNVDTTSIDLPITDTSSTQLLTTKPSGGAWTTTAIDGTEVGALEVNAVAVRLNATSLLVLSDDVAAGGSTLRLLLSTGVGQ